DQAVVLFGGNDGPNRLADTWIFARDAWTNVTALGAQPPARWGMAMTYDSEDGYVLLVNGCNNGNFLHDVWEFSGTAWRALSTSNPPPATCGSALVDDPGAGYVLFYSGDTSGGPLTSTAVYAHGSWTLLINPPSSTISAVTTLLVAAFFIVLIGLFAWIARRARRKQFAALADGFPFPPGSPVTWIETPRQTGRGFGRMAFPRILMVVVLLPVVFLIGYSINLLAGIVIAITYGLLMIGFIAAGSTETIPKSIGITPN
ncbi:hypothetical protein B1B_07709, partial [mine drainage metagenome]